MSTRDEHTGLMNLGAFSFVVDHVVKRASRAGECATVLSVRVGPTGGTPADSAAVYAAARMLRTELRGEDVVARVSPAEFAVALPDTDADQGEIVVGWITAKLAEQPEQHAGFVVGRATFDPTLGPVPAESLLDAARRSTAGPTCVRGESAAEGERGGPVARPGDASLPGRGAPASRRHLRSLRGRDA